MVIGSDVLALAVLVAEGAPCCGALVRDVKALGISVFIVCGQLGSGGGKDGATVTAEMVTLFLSLYAVFVVMVMVMVFSMATVLLD